MVWLKSMHVLRRYRTSCVWTFIRSRQGHPRNTSFRVPPPNPSSQHRIIMQEQLKFWKAAGLEHVWGCTICLPKGWKMVPEWPKAHTPRPHLAFSHTTWLLMTYVHVVHGWVWKWAQQVRRNANSPCLGGSSGRDDLPLSRTLAVLAKWFDAGKLDREGVG